MILSAQIVICLTLILITYKLDCEVIEYDEAIKKVKEKRKL